MARSDETNQTGTTRAGARDIQQHERMSHARRASGDWGELDLKVPNPFQDWGGDGDPSQLQTVTTWAQSGESRHLARFVGFPFVGVEPGERIETAEFELCGHRWSLWVCPGGMSEENAPFVSIFLAYKGSSSQVRAWFQFTFVDPRGLRTIVFVDDEEEGSVFEARGDHWGKHNCLLRTELRDRCPDGEFSIEVAMKSTQPHKPLSQNLQARGAPRPALTIPPPSLTFDLEALLESGLASDVTFIVGEAREEMRAHKAILIARCPVPILSEETMHLKEINVPDVDPDYFRELLRFIYTDEIAAEALEEMADELLSAANRFGLERLKALSAEQLSRSLAADNVCDILALASDEHAPQLQEICVAFCCQHPSEVCQTEGFSRLAAARPQLMADLFARMGTELPAANRGGPVGGGSSGGGAGGPGEKGGFGDKMKAWVDLIFVNPEAALARGTGTPRDAGRHQPPLATGSAGRAAGNLNGGRAGGEHESATPAGPDGGRRYRDMTGAYTAAPTIGSSLEVGKGAFHLL